MPGAFGKALLQRLLFERHGEQGMQLDMALPLSPAGTVPSLMPSERRFVLPVVQKANRPALFHQAPEPRCAESVSCGFGKRPIAPIGEPQTRQHDRIGRMVDDAPEASDEGDRHDSSWHN